MKKLLKVSLVAILAVGPVAAFAAGTLPAKYSNGSSQRPTLTPSSTLATKTYVQGAYDELVDSINLEDQKVGSLSVLTTGEGAAFTGTDSASATSIVSAINAAMTKAKEAANGNGLNTAAVRTLLDGDAGTALDYDTGTNKLNLKYDSSDFAIDTNTGNLTLSSTVTDALSAANSALSASDVAQTYDASGTAPISGAGVASALTNYALSTALDSKLNSSSADVAALQTGSYNAIHSGTDVAGNLVALDSALSTKQDVINANNPLPASYVDGALTAEDLTDGLNGYATQTYVDNKAIALAQTWNGSDTAVTLDELGSGIASAQH